MSEPQLFQEPQVVAATAEPFNGLKKARKFAFEPPNLDKAIRLPTPDFSDPNRKPTCLEVDFPIAPINALAKLEGNAGKPIYQMSKWWARRRSSVFRSLLIAAATEAPEKPEDAAKLVWDHYYCNHQKGGSFKKLRILEPFMGGGTTMVEGARLGFQLTGIDLNPVAWFVTKNELACSDPQQVKAMFDHIEAEVKPLIQPFYTTTCPRGHKGRWIDSRKESRQTGKNGNPAVFTPQEAAMHDGFDPIDLPPDQRKPYRWEGPEVIYTFWAKHGPCAGSQGETCGHRTPIFRSPIVAEKKLSTDYIAIDCPHCGHAFNAELGEMRMAPGAERVIVDGEPAFTELSQSFAKALNDYGKGNVAEKRQRVETLLSQVENEPGLTCPACSRFAGDSVKRVLLRHDKPSTRSAEIKKKDFAIQSRHVFMYLLVHPKWLQGSASSGANGQSYGGYAGADTAASIEWWHYRLNGLSLIEVRGRVKLDQAESASDGEMVDGSNMEDGEATEEGAEENERRKYGPPAQITLSDGTVVNTRAGTVPRQSVFCCAACGAESDLAESERQAQHHAPASPYALQCHCPQCAAEGFSYGGRYFMQPMADDLYRLAAALHEWDSRSKADLEPFWPKSELPYAWETHVQKGNLTHRGYTHWWKMFNPRQLLVHSQLLRAISDAAAIGYPLDVLEQALGAFQQYLRNQNMFCFWDRDYDKLVPMMSNPNYHPKVQGIENCVFHRLGRGNWESVFLTVMEGLSWARQPWDVAIDSADASWRIRVDDPVQGSNTQILCQSSTDLSALPQGFDLAVTDPPFGDNLFYADLADFFYVWLRIVLVRWYEGLPEQSYFRQPFTPKTMQAIRDPAQHPDDRELWEQHHFVKAEQLKTIREQSNNPNVIVGDDNPLYRPEPASDVYRQLLTGAWSEAARLLKPGGLLAFTFHHNKDTAWVDVLESLFNAGLILVATYPVKSDETKGDSANAAFGSKLIEYDIIHVCRKRLDSPKPVAWARMRRWVKDETDRYKQLLEHVHGQELKEPDLRVILRGKALEFYSRHYGQVLTGEGQVLNVRDALLGINQLLDDLISGEGAGIRRPPDTAEPASRLMLGLFAERDHMTRDELHKTLRGTGISPDDLAAAGWIRVVGTKVYAKPIPERFMDFRVPGRTRKNVLKADLDQAHFLIGAALPNSGVDITAELNSETWPRILKRSVDAVLLWYGQTGPDQSIREAASRAANLLAAWRDRPKTTAEAQLSLFAKLDSESN